MYVNRAAYANALYVNTNALFMEAFSSVESKYKQYTDEYRSTTKEEEYPYLEPPDGMVEWIGERATTFITDRAFRVKNRDWVQGVKIPLNDADDNRLVGVRDKITMLAAEAGMLWDQLACAALEAGTTSTWVDSQFFFDSDHQVNIDDSSKGTYQNNFDNTASGGNASHPLSFSNVIKLYEAALAFKKPNGQPMPVRMTHLIVPTVMQEKAKDILRRQFIAPAAAPRSYDVASIQQENPAKDLGLQVLALDHLTSSTAWYLAKLDQPRGRPIGVQIREDIQWQEIATPNEKSGPMSSQIYRTRVWEAGPWARGEAFLKWPWRIIRANT